GLTAGVVQGSFRIPYRRPRRHADEQLRSGRSTRSTKRHKRHLVHSLDAAHMMLTVNRLHSCGLRHFAMVHDSFGVHAGDVDLLSRVLREECVGMYSEPVIMNVLKERLQAGGIALPAFPPP